jgi:hypothetical protein
MSDNQRFAGAIGRAHLIQKRANGFPDQGRTAITMHVAFAWHEFLPVISALLDVFRTLAGSLSFEDK